jgi:hypothetical protein
MLTQVFEGIKNWGKSWQGVEKVKIVGRHNLQPLLPSAHVKRKEDSRQRLTEKRF